MNTLLENPGPSPRDPGSPRRRNPPTDRDQQIYALYNYEGRRQVELAAQFNLSQGHISQIIRSVAAWQSMRRPDHHESPTDTARLSRHIQEERLNLICREAIRQFYGSQTVLTKKSGTRGDKDFAETIERTTPANIHCLKVLLAATRDLGRLAQSDPATAAKPSPYRREQIMQEELLRLYQEAIAAGSVPPNPDPAAVIDRWLNDLLGEAHPPGESHPPSEATPPSESSPPTHHPTAPTENRETTNIANTALPGNTPQLVSPPPLQPKTRHSQTNEKPPILLYPPVSRPR